MSRIGRKPVAIPNGVTVTVNGSTVAVKGSKGELSYVHLPLISVAVEGSEIVISRSDETKAARERHGLTRALIQNMVTGVTDGYEKKLEVIGVGFKTAVKGQTLTLNIGFSHPVDFAIPEGVTIVQDEKNKNILFIRGIDRQLVGQTASDIRALKPPEPYKGKGIRYSDEHVRRKVGKAATAKAA
ncbi:MAG: 50S ribosomal protein L6 [Candidatus Peribacteraceae bacterium]|nr:50S ribosomal protein L6 [Candidatus Peribacteraceae bacterium]